MTKYQLGDEVTVRGFTPGPWRVAENEWNLGAAPWREAGLVEGDTGAGYAVPPLICAVYRGDETDANAQLISAAPDLLEALSIIVANAVIQQDAAMGYATDCYAVPLDDIEGARAAIAKAVKPAGA